METRKFKLLVVEDEGLIAADLSDRLTALGHEVIAIAETAAEAVAKAPGADLVLMDIRLEGPGDGIDAAARIRDTCRVPVIFLTAHTDRATLERAKLIGPFGYLVKPVGQGALQTAIEIAIYRHRMERELEEREAWLSSVVGSISDAVIAVDPEGRIRTLNPMAEALTGWGRAEASGQPVATILPLREALSGDTSPDPVALAVLRDATVPLGRDVVLTVRDGTRKSVEGSADPVKAGGHIIGVALAIRDITARRWQETQIRQAQRLEVAEHLSSALHHEYSNLLATIRNRAHLVLDRFRGYAPLSAPLEEILDASATAEEIARRLGAFTAPQAGNREWISLNGILRGMLTLIESVAAEHAEIVMRLHPHAGKIHADAAQIEQVVLNLVLNACSLMPSPEPAGESEQPADAASGLKEIHAERGPRQSGKVRHHTICIETAPRDVPELGSFAQLTVVHNGRTPEIESLFEPSLASEDSGGLAVAHGIVAEHEGLFSAEPVAGGGCRFEILFPRWSKPEKEFDREPGLFTILLVEPRSEVRSELHNFFEAHGCNLLEAADLGEAAALCELQSETEGQEAVDQACGTRLDLIIAKDSEIAALAATRPGVPALSIVDGPERSPREIHKHFTRRELLDRVLALLNPQPDAHTASA